MPFRRSWLKKKGPARKSPREHARGSRIAEHNTMETEERERERGKKKKRALAPLVNYRKAATKRPETTRTSRTRSTRAAKKNRRIPRTLHARKERKGKERKRLLWVSNRAWWTVKTSGGGRCFFLDVTGPRKIKMTVLRSWNAAAENPRPTDGRMGGGWGGRIRVRLIYVAGIEGGPVLCAPVTNGYRCDIN